MNSSALAALPVAQESSSSALETVWDLQTRWTWTPWFTLLFIVLVVMLVTALYVRETSPAGPIYRGLLAILRLTTIGLVLLMLSEILLTSSEQGLPRLQLVVDTSASMGLPAEEHDQTRLEAALQVLLSDDGALLNKWQRDYELQVAAAADGTTMVEAVDGESLATAISQLTSDGPLAGRSRLGDAIQTAIEAGEDGPPAAVVLLTDGRTTAGRSLDEARIAARRQGVPLFVVGLGSTRAPADLALSDLLADELALSGDLVAIEATLTSRGVDAQTVSLKVIDKATGETVAEKPVEIGANESRGVQMLVRPERPGKVTYRIEVASLDGEQNVTNNRLEHTIDIRDEKLRVLVAAGYPNYEYRYLHALLSRDSTFELSTFLQEADVEHPSQEATALGQLPLKTEEIEEFDVVVLIDLDPRLLPPRWWQSIEHLVVRRGGGLVLVAGPRYFPAQYRGITEIFNLAPIDPSSASSSRGVIDSGFQIELTSLGQQWAPMQLGSTAAESAAVWNSLPDQYWYSDIQQVKPAAQVLAVHPRARTAEGRPLPLFCLQYVGSGRVLYHGVDSTWRWRYRVGDAWFARYWGQSLRHLARSKISSDEQGARILVEQTRFDLGQPVRVQVRLHDMGTVASATSPELILEAEGQPPRRIPLTASRLAPHVLHATASELPPGNYRVRLGEPQLTPPPEVVDFEVTAPPGELADATMNEDELRALAKDTYGKFYTAKEATTLAGDLPKGSRAIRQALPPMELWNQWWILMAITGCLTLEWVLRKRQAML